MTILERNGHKLGCLPRTTKVGDGTFRIFGEPETDTPVIIPEDEYDSWSPTNNLLLFHWHTLDQGSQGSCAGAATVGALALGREQAGLNRVVLSQASVYGIGNGGRDNGMAIDTGLRILAEYGACPTSVIDQYDWRGYWNGTWPANWEEEAKKYRCLEAFDCPTFQHAMSAVFLGYPVVYGTAGHAIVMVGRKKSGEHYDLNSWGSEWGEYGIGQWRSDADTAQGIRTYGAWAIRVATDPIDDEDVPAPLLASASTATSRPMRLALSSF